MLLSINSDKLLSHQIIQDRLLNWTTYQPTLATVEQSTAEVMMNITPSSFLLSIYALNGSICQPQPCEDIFIAPLTNVTWRIQYQLPSSSFRSLSFQITNFPHDIWVDSFLPSISSIPPPTGSSWFGPRNTINLQAGAPLPTVKDSSHQMAWTYSNSPPLEFNTTSFIDLLYTIVPDDSAYRAVYFQFLDVGGLHVSASDQSLRMLTFSSSFERHCL